MTDPHTTDGLSEARARMTDHEQMLDAQYGCLPCKLCGGNAVITDAGTGAGYYIRCRNSVSFREYKGCMLDERRLSGWAYNVMDWWNRLHTPPAIPSTAIAAGEGLTSVEGAEAILRAKPWDRNAARDILRRKVDSVEGSIGADVRDIIDARDSAEEHDPDGIVYAVIEAMIDFAVETSVEEFASLLATAPKAASEDGATGLREQAARVADEVAEREEEAGEGGGREWATAVGIAAAIRALASDTTPLSSSTVADSHRAQDDGKAGVAA